SPVGFGSTEFHVLRPSSRINGRYLFHLIWNDRFREFATPKMTGSAGQRRVPAGVLENLEIPLPSLEEQIRITAILDKAYSICRKRTQALARADAFLSSVFGGLVGPYNSDYLTWPECKFEELALSEKGSMRTGPFGSDLKHSEFVSHGIA